MTLRGGEKIRVTGARQDGTKNEFSGHSTSVVQAASVYGGIHYHPTGLQQFPPPRQLPAGVARFVDRDSTLNELNELIESLIQGVSPKNSTPTIAAIIGPPGVGKTALALHWAHQIRSKFPDGDLYIDMGAYGSGAALSVEQALDNFLRSLNVDPTRIPADLEERVALYRSILGNRRLLILIDNVSSVRQVRNLLPGSHQCLAIVTSRSSLAGLVAREGATRVTLDILAADDAIHLLAEIIGDERIESDPDSAAKIVRLCGYLPLALRVVAERIAGRPYLPLREIVRELVSEQTRLDVLASAEDELTNVRAVFSWSYRALGPEQQRVFRLIGLHAGPEFSTTVAAALVDVPIPIVRDQIQQLASAHLVQEIAENRYRLHDLLRAYSIECGQREESQRERTHAIRRMMSWYLLTADAARQIILPFSHLIAVVPLGEITIPVLRDATDAMGWYEQERVNLLNVLKQAMDLGHYDVAWKLPVISDGFFELRSYWLEWMDIHEEGVIAARAIGDAIGESSNLLCLGDANWRLGHQDQALRHYGSSAAIAATIEDRWLEGFSLRGQGLIYQERQQFEESIRYFERALAVFKRSNIRRGEGMALLSLGNSYRGLGQYEAATEYGTGAVAIFEEIGDEWSKAWAIPPLANTYIEQGSVSLAEPRLMEALSIFQRFGDRRSEALVYYTLGDGYRRRGYNDRARESLSNALQIFEEIGDSRTENVRDLIASLSRKSGD